MSVADQLKAAFPHLSGQQVDEALRRTGGDPNRAGELLLTAPPAKCSAAVPCHQVAPTPARSGAANVPDIRTQPEAWFRFFDRDGNGLEQHEVVDAVVQTFGADRAVVRELVASLWPMFDTDRSGAISMREFTKRDGLRETLLAQMGPAHQQQARPPVVQATPVQATPVPAGYRPGQPVVAGGYAPGAPVVQAIPVAPAAPALGRGPVRPTGRRRAVLIGINYFGTRAQLRGCINDVHNMQRLLTQSFGWQPSCMQVLTDDNPRAMPTRGNIEAAMRWLVDGVQPGDVLFFHYSGHGAQQEDPHGFEEDGMNETILPVDFKTAGMMTDDFMGDLIVKRLPEGVRLTAVMDCCHSGTGLDLPYTWTGRGWREETNPFHSLGDVQMFSGCADDDTSADASTAYGAPGGAMTTSFCDVLRSNPCPTYPELISNLNMLMHRRGFSQHAQLTSSQCFDIDRRFLLDDIMLNRNPTVGRIFRRRFPPRPRPMEGPLADMLGIGAAVVGGMILGDVVGDALGGLFGGFFD